MNKYECGVYLLREGDSVVYVGQSKTCLLTRVRFHMTQGVKKFDNVTYIACPFEEVDELERDLIARYKPKYNVAKGGMNNVVKQEDLPDSKKRKDIDVMLRVNAYEKELFKEAAQIDQRRLRDWMRVSLVRAAEKMIKERA